MRLLVIASPQFAPLKMLRDEAPDVEAFVTEDLEAAREAMLSSDAIVIAPRHTSMLRDLAPFPQNVRWIHTLSAGVDQFPFDELKNTNAVVTNSRGVFADALAEFALASMLWFAKDLRRLVRNQDARRWEPFTVERLEGSTAGIVGYGGIGQAVARRASAFGVRVLYTRRSPDAGAMPLEDVLRQSHYVVLCTPLTPDTRGLISAAQIARMPAHAILINIGRGALVDEPALVTALQNAAIRGAALDVYATEPLPAGSPLWTLENVLLSPHSADHVRDSHERAMRFLLENLGLFRSGQPLRNVVDKSAQY